MILQQYLLEYLFFQFYFTDIKLRLIGSNGRNTMCSNTTLLLPHYALMGMPVLLTPTKGGLSSSFTPL